MPAFRECLGVFGEALEPNIKEEDEIKEEIDDFVDNTGYNTDDCKEIGQ